MSDPIWTMEENDRRYAGLGSYVVRKVGRQPDDPVARCTDPEDARLIVEALNALEAAPVGRVKKVKGTKE